MGAKSLPAGKLGISNGKWKIGKLFPPFSNAIFSLSLLSKIRRCVVSFPFENLEVYKRSLVLIDEVDQLCEEAKGKLTHSFQDQLNRAVLSIALNIAEGNGRWHMKDKQQFFWIARGSVFEIVPLLQVLRRRNLIGLDRFNALYESLEVVAKMLTNLIKSVENLNRQSTFSHAGTPRS